MRFAGRRPRRPARSTTISCSRRRARWPTRVAGLRLGRFALDKQLPVAAGLGGGSSDAAAALRLLARANGLPLDDERLRAAARATGADVPVCLDPRPRMMRGIGEILSEPMALPELPAVLVNPGVAVPTRDVFAALAAPALTAPAQTGRIHRHRCRRGVAGFDRWPRAATISKPPAITLQPVIADVLAALRRSPDCLLARMSGSGATCFGLFGSSAAAQDAARRIAGRASAAGGCTATLLG